MVGSVVPSVGVTVVSDGCVTSVEGVVSAGSLVDGTVTLGSVGTTVLSSGVLGVSVGVSGTVGTTVSSEGAEEVSVGTSGVVTTAGTSDVTGAFSSANAVRGLAEASTATDDKVISFVHFFMLILLFIIMFIFIMIFIAI